MPLRARSTHQRVPQAHDRNSNSGCKQSTAVPWDAAQQNPQVQVVPPSMHAAPARPPTWMLQQKWIQAGALGCCATTRWCKVRGLAPVAAWRLWLPLGMGAPTQRTSREIFNAMIQKCTASVMCRSRLLPLTPQARAHRSQRESPCSSREAIIRRCGTR